MNFPLVISFYTKDTPYEQEVQNLIASCKKFHLETEIEGVPSLGKWELNCSYKPFFIIEKLEKFKKPVLWVDADGVFLRQPSWQEAFEADLSVRYDPTLPSTHPSQVITSTLFARPSALPLLKQWIEQTHHMLLDPNRKEEFWDQIALREAIHRVSEKISVRSLPLSYAKIFDHPGDNEQVRVPVIEHYQASRRMKIFDSLQ